MNKILVTYATRAGSTFEVAVIVAEVLRATGATVDVKYVRAVHELKGYDAVVIGSAIRMGQWLPEAVEFVKVNRETLSHIPTAYFLVSGFLREDSPEMRQRALAYLDPVRKILEPTSIGLFAGKMDYSKMDWIDRSIAEAVSSSQGDWRNWEAIRSWAHDLLPALSRVMGPQSEGAS
jgi:menaquinone-dependent protoporphyrinogen oxidase